MQPNETLSNFINHIKDMDVKEMGATIGFVVMQAYKHKHRQPSQVVLEEINKVFRIPSQKIINTLNDRYYNQ